MYRVNSNSTPLPSSISHIAGAGLTCAGTLPAAACCLANGDPHVPGAQPGHNTPQQRTTNGGATQASPVPARCLLLPAAWPEGPAAAPWVARYGWPSAAVPEGAW
jgi:hypothetical protein